MVSVSMLMACLLSCSPLLQCMKCYTNLRSFLLVRHPDVLDKLRREVADIGDKVLTRARLQNMVYLQHIINESRTFGS